MIVKKLMIITWGAIKNKISSYIETENKVEFCLDLSQKLIERWEEQHKIKIDKNFKLPHFALASQLDSAFRYYLRLYLTGQILPNFYEVFSEFVQPRHTVETDGIRKELDEYEAPDFIKKKQTIYLGGGHERGQRDDI